MKDEKAKYLIIDSNEIFKSKSDDNNVMSLDSNLSYKIRNAKHIFENNGVPEEYQKIIIKINIPYFLNNEAEEYTMGFPFDITGGKIECENNKKFITVSSFSSLYVNKICINKIKFKTELIYSNFEQVMNFLTKIYNDGYLMSYFKSIKDFFDISIDLDLINESWIESKYNAKIAKKLYKKRFLNK